MAKTITISDELAQNIYDFCEDELDWHINECVASEYESEILAQIELLRLLGYEEDADAWDEAYKETIENEEES